VSRTEGRLPPLGDEAGDEATVSVFFRGPGEEIKADDDLVEMITDKAAFTVPSPVTGTIVSIEVAENDVVKVGEVLAVVEAPD